MKKRHSQFGIASLTLALIPSLLIALPFVLGYCLGDPSQHVQDTPPLAEILASVIMVGLSIAIVFVFSLFWLVATVFGIVNLFQSERKKHFGILGLILTALGIAMTVLIAAGIINDLTSGSSNNHATSLLKPTLLRDSQIFRCVCGQSATATLPDPRPLSPA